jgi:hypothetical protein
VTGDHGIASDRWLLAEPAQIGCTYG